MAKLYDTGYDRMILSGYQTMSRRATYRLIMGTAGLFLAFTVGVTFWFWFAPIGTGEFRESPDGRYTAHANNMSRGAVTGGRTDYIELKVVENSTGRTVWQIEQHHTDGTDVPDYGARGVRFITWSADSSSVTVPVACGRELVLAVP